MLTIPYLTKLMTSPIHKPTTKTCQTLIHNTKSIPHTTTNMMIIKKTPNVHMPPTHHPTIEKNTQGTYNTNFYSYRSQNISQHQNMQQTYDYQTPQKPFRPFSNKLFIPMSTFNRPGHTPVTSSTQQNYSGMGHELSYDIVSFYTQDFLEMQELLRDYVDVSETSNPQTRGMNQQRGQQFRIARGCGIGD